VSADLIISTYKRPDALELVLKSVEMQSTRPRQVIISDDGSGSNTKLLIDRWKRRLPITHVWQRDADFRAARVRNLAILRVKSEYVVTVDGDCILPPDFIRNHLALAERKKVVVGGRSLLSEVDTETVIKSKKFETKGTSIFKGSKFFTLPLGPLRALQPKNWELARTCNMGFFQADVLGVGGFDERYVGWGFEDSDLMVRLIRSGITLKSGRFSVCVAHLYHPEAPRFRNSVNAPKFDELLNSESTHLPSRSCLSTNV